MDSNNVFISFTFSEIESFFSARLFSEKTQGFAIAFVWLVSRVGVIVMQKQTFCNISVITDDIYLKLGVCVHYPKSNPYYQERQFKMLFFFFSLLCPFFN